MRLTDPGVITPSTGDAVAWSVDPARSRIALTASADGAVVSCWPLDRSGRVVRHSPGWRVTTPDDGSWAVLGWVSPSLLALWRRSDDRTDLYVVDVLDGEPEPARYKVLGRPVACGLDGSGRLEVLVALSNGGRPILCVYRPDIGSYLPIGGKEQFAAVGAWDSTAGLIAVNVDAHADAPGVQLYGYDGYGSTEIQLSWPADVRPASAAGYRQGVLGLTGMDRSGMPVPGVSDVATGAVRWFPRHAGHSCVEPAPSGARILTCAWTGREFTYRLLAYTGDHLGELDPGPGVATDLCFSADEEHLIGWHQSPAQPPDVMRWSVRSGRAERVRRARARPVSADMRWHLRWVPDAEDREVPEWVFEPGGDSGGTVLFLHGGPRSRLNQIYDPVIAALVAAGWTVVGMNYPGSSGYGARYRDRAVGDWGGPDARAITRRLRSLRGGADRGPLCLYGQSYGGYLALLVASVAPELLDAVAVWAPVTDLARLLAGSAGARRSWLETELGALRFDTGQLWERSPVSRVPQLRRTRLLVGHGSRDEQCPVEQSRLLVELLEVQLPAGGRLGYLEDPDGRHAPSSWRWWTDAVAAHFRQPSPPRAADGRGPDAPETTEHGVPAGSGPRR
jgi:hypothetical protein